MSRFIFHPTPIAGVVAIERQPLGDARGFLERLFCADDLAPAGWSGAIAQINHTFTAEPGTVRGMHFQRAPHAETKLVSCLAGAVWDMAVDLRPGSPTYLQWHAEELSADNHRALLIPPGCAHGFQTLGANVQMLYCHSQAYAPHSEGGLHPQDPRLGIPWPLPVHGLSPRDASHPFIEGEHS